MASSYWSKYLQQRTISRRKALGLAASGLTGAALLAACGSDDDNGGSSGGSPTTGGGSPTSGGSPAPSGLVATAEDTSSSATRGGILNIHKDEDQPDWDPLAASGASTTNLTAAFYSRLLKHKVGIMGPADGSVEGDAAESWEISDDAMTVTLKLRDMQWDHREPTSGRKLTAEDVKFSWDKFSTSQRLRADLANAENEHAPILNFEAVDDTTVRINLAFPYAAIEDLLAWPVYLQLMPTESDGGFDPQAVQRGSGAWLLEEYVASQVIKLRRNENWYEDQRPYLDGLDMFIIDNTTTGISQLETGALAYYPAMLAEDVIPTKKRAPDLQMYQKPGYRDRGSTTHVALGTQPGSPFLDVRVRQAMSMLYDRELWMETFFNLEGFRSEGLDMSYRVMTMVPPGLGEFWVDPTDPALGPGGKYLQYNPAEAKKLLEAAGQSLPIEMDFTYPTNAYGPAYAKFVEVTRGMFEADGDFKFNMRGTDYQTEFRYDYSNAPGTFDGICLSTGRSAANIDLYLFGNWHRDGSKPKFTEPDLKAEELMAKQRTIVDPEERNAVVHELLAHVTEQMHFVPYGGEVLDFELAQPYLGNFGAFESWYSSPHESSWLAEAVTHYWLKET